MLGLTQCFEETGIVFQFFFDKGASHQPLHQLMHMTSLLTKSASSTKFNHYNQSKGRVDTKINQKKTRPIQQANG
jgi:hypothetical protein